MKWGIFPARTLALGVAAQGRRSLAFFAGLAFSRDPEAVRADASFQPLFEFFLPFFFICGTKSSSVCEIPQTLAPRFLAVRKS